MKKLFMLMVVVITPHFLTAQSCAAQSCDKKSCGPEGTKKEEAAVITTMRTDLQTVIARIAKSPVAFDKTIREMTIEKGASDDESLLFISQAASSIRYELMNRIESAKLNASLKAFRPGVSSTKQQMVANLKKEIQLLATQAENL